MTRKLWRVALILLPLGGCRTPGAPSSGQTSPSSVASVAQTVPTVSAAPSASVMPSQVGSLPNGTKEERERALFTLLESGRVSQLPVVATEPGVGIDRSLRSSLLGHLVEAPVRRGIAQLGPAIARGGEIANLNRVVAGMRAGFRSCYQRGLAQNPDYEGKLDVWLTVDAQGAVSTAKVTSSKRNEVVSTCIEWRAKASQFDAPAGGQTATVTFSVTLSKQ